jgi:hypothetical protein
MSVQEQVAQSRAIIMLCFLSFSVGKGKLYVTTVTAIYIHTHTHMLAHSDCLTHSLTVEGYPNLEAFIIWNHVEFKKVWS